MSEQNNALLCELRSKFSDENLSKLYQEGQYIEVNADFDELNYCIKQRTSFYPN